MTAFYNEIDPFKAQWLRNLIAAGVIAPGIVDERSIEDIKPNELFGYTQVHLFAGIGIWSHALRLAGWADDREVWTISCPCQPFSTAGKGDGFEDERHLWPATQHLLAQCRPATVIGEQVASKDAEHWIDLVCADMEIMDYAFGAVAFPAAGVGAPHIRLRTYWMGYADRARLEGRSEGHHSARGHGEGSLRSASAPSDSCGLVNTNGQRFEPAPLDRVRAYTEQDVESLCPAVRPNATNGLWRDADWLLCRDQRWRPVEPGTFPLVDGTTARVGRLRAYGDGIVAPQAKVFIESVMECIK